MRRHRVSDLARRGRNQLVVTKMVTSARMMYATYVEGIIKKLVCSAFNRYNEEMGMYLEK